MQIPIQCNTCEKLFDLKPLIRKKHWDMPSTEAMKSIFEDGEPICKECSDYIDSEVKFNEAVEQHVRNVFESGASEEISEGLYVELPNGKRGVIEWKVSFE